MFRIERVREAADLAAVAGLFRLYADSLPIDLGYQGFEAELASLPGRFAPPEGELLLARSEGEALGCVALRPFSEGVCEMKRLYVAPSGRGMGVGRALVELIVAEAVAKGYREMRLDTLSSMDAALSIYRKAGFVEVPAYYDTPVKNTVFMARSF